MKELRNPFISDRLPTFLTGKSNARPGGPHFGSNSPLYGAKLKSNARGMPGVCPGGIGGFGIDWYIIADLSKISLAAYLMP